MGERIRLGLIARYTSFLYEVTDTRIILHFFWDNRQELSIPVTIGVVGVIFTPVLAAVGALAVLVTECKITVEREEPEGKEKADENDAT